MRVGYSTGTILSVGAFRLPQKRGSSTLSLVIAAPGILMFGPHFSIVTVGFKAEHLVGAGLDFLLVDDLVGEHGDGRGLGIERLLDFDLFPALADEIEADRRAVRRHQHHIAGLLALGFKRSDGGHGQMGGMHEDQVDVGIGDELVGDDGSGVRGFPLHGGQRDDLHVREFLHLLLEALLDVERVGIGRVAEHLEDLALHVAVLLLEQALDFAGGDIADLDGAGDRGEVGQRRGDLPVEFHDRNAGGAGLLDRGLQAR